MSDHNDAIPKTYNLDSLLTLEEAAALLQMSPKTLAAKSKGRRAPIPGIWINRRVVRFHPRMMLAKAAHDNGMPLDLIAATLNVRALQLEELLELIRAEIRRELAWHGAPADFEI